MKASKVPKNLCWSFICYNVKIMCVNICAPQLLSSNLREVGKEQERQYQTIKHNSDYMFPVKQKIKKYQGIC
jgi:hypothetical protein